MKILVVFANPRGTSALRLGEEDRTINECFRRAKNRDSLSLRILHASTVDDIRRALLDDEYEIVHFSGHGTGTGLAFEDKDGRLYVPPQNAVAQLLADFSPPLKCLLLNACYSTSQGQSTSLGVPFTIAMEGPVSDDAAILFAEGFYDSIGAGKDIEFSFRQGLHALRLAGHPDTVVPKLLKKGEFTSGTGPVISQDAGRVSTRSTETAPPLLLGVGLDVSGSMEQNLRTSLGRQQSRLRGFADAFEQSVSRVREFMESVREAPSDTASVFAYAFGMRSGDVCDLLSLMKIANSVVSPDEIERLKQQYSREIERRYSGSSSLGGLEALARGYGFGGVVESVKRGVRADAEAEVRNRIIGEIQRRLADQLRSVGETTLDIEQLADLWKGDSPSWDNAEHLIFGNTPMCSALRLIIARFKSELERRASAKPTPILLLVSDGEPTDGDPIPLADELRKLGVTCVCCYITDRDVIATRTLVSASDESWPMGAKMMFDLASEVPDDSPLTHFLLRNGWTVNSNARAFVQANHSEALEELIGMAMSPVERGYTLLPKGT